MLTVERVDNPDWTLVEAVHRLLVDEMTLGLVEDLPSMAVTLSPTASCGAVPIVVCATDGPDLRGAVIGSYLPAVNVGMVLYSAVIMESRGQGVYREMRKVLAGSFTSEAAARCRVDVEYLVSEQQPGSDLLSAYLHRWGAYEAALDYEQPQVQGLEQRPLTLVFLPVAADGPPSVGFALRVVREIYRHVYRIDDPDRNESYLRIVQSVCARKPGEA